MNYFTPDFIEFFKELAPNNHKEWFDQNRARYEKVVKEPFKAFVGDLALHLTRHKPLLELDPKTLIFRINRDIRFSKDKRPYKTFVSAIISPGGKKDKTMPGMYFEFGPEGILVYGGVFMVNKEQLEDIRYYIANNMETFKNIISEKQFVSTFGSIKGEVNVRLPKELQEIAEEEPLIYNKQFYFYTALPSQLLISNDVIEELEKYFLIMKPLNDFFEVAMGY